MTRIFSLLLSAAALSACATSTMADKTKAAQNPNATTVEVMAPTPVVAPEGASENMSENVNKKTVGAKMTDVMGNKLMTSDAAMKSAAPAESAEAAAPKLENLYYVAQTKWEMMTFVEAVNTAELATALEAKGAMTIFAPTSDAFAQAGDVAATAELLKGHIVPGKLTAKDLMARAAKGENSLPTLAGTELTLYVMGETVKIADAGGRLYTVVAADDEASNGVLHQINGVFSGR